MGITYGIHQPPYQPVSIAHRASNRQIRFDNPDDLLKEIARHPELEEEILAGEWVWTTQEVQGGRG
jgi:hypothetical protein